LTYVESLSGLNNRSIVSTFIVHFGIPNAFEIPECTIKFDTLALFFGRPDDDSTEAETCRFKNILYNKMLCLTRFYTLYELDKHFEMTNVKKKCFVQN
jgi:hypothetical protein